MYYLDYIFSHKMKRSTNGVLFSFCNVDWGTRHDSRRYFMDDVLVASRE